MKFSFFIGPRGYPMAWLTDEGLGISMDTGNARYWIVTGLVMIAIALILKRITWRHKVKALKRRVAQFNGVHEVRRNEWYERGVNGYGEPPHHPPPRPGVPPPSRK